MIPRSKLFHEKVSSVKFKANGATVSHTAMPSAIQCIARVASLRSVTASVLIATKLKTTITSPAIKLLSWSTFRREGMELAPSGTSATADKIFPATNGASVSQKATAKMIQWIAFIE